MIAGLTACNSKKQKFEFDHAQEAIAACHQELATVKDQKDATIDELVARINIWQELQDSTLTLMVRDSTLQNDARLASEFFAVTDSFRMVITRLALAKQRSMADVVKLKVGTSASRAPRHAATTSKPRNRWIPNSRPTTDGSSFSRSWRWTTTPQPC